ncbi:Hypothetical protein PHPALM_16122 [Phytophthora palmivora]|uniref:Uncharacterized protein n=1 Tax=Phytophthora palmivora TaxID=4796 RepID=A0A2P4XQH7_9STRA|nr:Hypothetical protein PHPALM_16122 [Phytophthora palmivora]
MAPTGPKSLNSNDVDENVKAFLQPSVGLSTLDLLARSSPGGISGWNDPAVPAKVRREMHRLAKNDMIEMADTLHANQASRPRAHDMNTLGLHKDPSPLGEQISKPKTKFVHGTPVQRRLIGGKLIRITDLDERTLSSSVSAPELSRAIIRELKGLKEQREMEQDALDLALSSTANSKENPKPRIKTPPPVRELSPADEERIALRKQENILQSKLLQATQKLSRKYQKQLDPRRGPATCKIHALAQKWEQQQSQHDPENASTASVVDQERYNLYVAGRFSTQAELDYYQRQIEPREPATDKHRRHTMHTKYGNALAKNKCSLRGPF